MKTKTAKKPVKKTAPKVKKNKSVEKKIPIQIQPISMSVRVLQSKPLLSGRKHFISLVENSVPKMLTFNSNQEINDWLFDFEVRNCGNDPSKTGTWIDMIITNVDGDFYGIDELESKK